MVLGSGRRVSFFVSCYRFGSFITVLLVGFDVLTCVVCAHFLLVAQLGCVSVLLLLLAFLLLCFVRLVFSI